MKLRIMQQGGGLIYTPFIPGAQGATTTSSKSSDSSEPKLDPLDKELISLMKDQNLLPSDIQQIYNRLIRFQKQTQSLSGLEGTDAYRSAMPGMLQILGMVNEAKYNKAQSDEIVQRMAQQNAGADAALDAYGRMYVYDKDGEMKKIDISEFDHEKYVPISNSQLLSMRQRQFGFQDNIMNDLENMVGMSSVQDEIAKIISKIGSAETSAYIKNPSANKVLQALMAEGPEGVYKLSQKDRSEGLQPAWNAIYTQLPQNMRNLLRANAAIFNTDPILMIQDIVLRSTDTKTDIDYDASASKAAGYDTDPNKEASEQLTQNNFLQMVGNLRGSKTLVSIAPRAAKINERAAITAPAYTWGRVIDRNKEPIKTQSLTDALKNGWGFAAGDPQTVVFGNKLLKNWELSAIMFDEQSNFTAVMLPYTIDNGHYVPNFELLDKFNQLQEIIDNNPYISRTELQAQIDKLQLNINDIYNFETNTFELQNTMPFISVSGIASDEILNLTDSNKKYLEHLDKDDGGHLKDYYNNMVKYGKLHPEKKAVEIGGYSSAGKRSFWEGNIFIPMQSDFYAMALSGIGEYVPKANMTQYVERAAAREIERDNQYRARAANPNWETIGQF